MPRAALRPSYEGHRQHRSESGNRRGRPWRSRSESHPQSVARDSISISGQLRVRERRERPASGTRGDCGLHQGVARGHERLDEIHTLLSFSRAGELATYADFRGSGTEPDLKPLSDMPGFKKLVEETKKSDAEQSVKKKDNK